MFRQRTVAPLVAIIASLLLAPSAHAQVAADGYRNAHRLGGRTSFYKPPLTNVASLKRMAASPKMADDVRSVLRDAGLSDTSDAVLAMLSSGMPTVVSKSCADVTAADGVLVDCLFPRGGTLEWMAYRPNAVRGDRTPGHLTKVRWAGQPFRAFLFRVTTATGHYTFVVPKTCGNLSLMSAELTPRATPPPPPPAPVVVAPPPAPAPRVEPPAQPAPAPPVVEPPPAQAAPIKHPLFFVDLLGGKDRRVRPIGDRTTLDGSNLAVDPGAEADFTQCSPLVGLKFGVAKRFENNWELAGALGVAFSLVTADDKVREHALFADVEANKYLGGGSFVGTGISLWDLTHTDTLTPAWLLHAGVPLGHSRVYLVGEGRLFLDHADDVSNNYLLWAGLRARF